MKKLLITIIIITLFTSCESKQARKEREAREQKVSIELEQRQREEAILSKQARIEQEKKDEAQRKEQEIYNRYISNSLLTGSTPYSKYYGKNSTCPDYGCSQIKVRTSNSDVLVTIKKNNKVVRHAYIQAGDSYAFSFPNGTYQTFFYYGKGWNPEKEMKGGAIKGGFVSNEEFGKDQPQSLHHNILEYELILQQNGNFSTRPSNPDEAL